MTLMKRVIYGPLKRIKKRKVIQVCQRPVTGAVLSVYLPVCLGLTLWLLLESLACQWKLLATGFPATA